jgi:5'-deoxynucleotidase
MKLGDMYRAGDVNRWQIVKTLKQQSVAEHSFHVAVISLHLFRKVAAHTKTDVSSLAEVVLRWALMHDMPEVLTGDVATPFKMMIKAQGCDPFSQIEDSVCEEYKRTKEELSPLVRHVVKLADLIEAVRFLHDNVCTPHGEKIYGLMRLRIEDYDFREAGGLTEEQWRIAVGETLAEMFCEPTTLDDVVFRNMQPNLDICGVACE